MIRPDIVIEDARWAEAGIAALAERVLAPLAAELGLAEAELCLLACDDARIAALNAAHRGKEGPTNVLSFPALPLAPATPGAPPPRPAPDALGELFLGDVAIAFETCAREAAAQGKALADHASHLVLHGALHLLGYDHETEADAQRMEAIEVAILASLGIADPYSTQQAGTGLTVTQRAEER